MVAITNAVAGFSLAVLVSLGQWLGDGMAAFEKEDYKSAAALFTKVIEAESPYNPDKHTALYMRARCFMALKLNKDAVRDLTTLLRAEPHEELGELAVADYKELTGKDWAGDRSS